MYAIRSYYACSNVVIATLTNTNFTFDADITTVDAHCGQNDGTAAISLNPAAFYTITWSNGGSGEVQNNLSAGA